MAYKVIILYQLYMPSYFLGTFTEYPFLRCEEFRRSVKESLSGPVQANRSDGTKPCIGIERKNKTYVKTRLIFLIGIFYSDPQLYLLKISSLLRGCLS